MLKTFARTAVIATTVLGTLMTTTLAEAKTAVLVHGSWMSAAVWDKTAAFLKKDGYEVLAVTLPAHGEDATPAEKASLKGYVDAVIAAIGERRDVLLVGHSFGGIVISAAAEAVPDKIARLVYVAGYVPKTGESAYSLSQQDKASLVGTYWRQADPAAYSPASIAPEGIVETFCADCAAAEAAALVAQHRAEPVPPLATPVELSAAAFGKVPKAYVVTTMDRTISPDLQKTMLAGAGITDTVELSSSHSPMLSMPDKLAAALIKLGSKP